MRYKHALVIGKFYPPHIGHHYVVSTAAWGSDAVTVVAMASSAESIPLHSRVQWMREEHERDEEVSVTGVQCEAPIDFESPLVWKAQVTAMLAAVRLVSLEPLDAVYGSEPYIHRLAKEISLIQGSFVTPVTVDEGRVTKPVSSTLVRSNLGEHWDDLSMPVRRGLCTRIIVVGAESTGTTTLSLDLMKHYQGLGGEFTNLSWIGEYGREYTIEKLREYHSEQAALDAPYVPLEGTLEAMDALTWTPDDFALISRVQLEREERGAVTAPLLICDTDAWATRLWERRYLGKGSFGAVNETPRLPQRALYIVTDDEGVSFHQDGIRDGERIRHGMTQWFIDGLTREGQPWMLVTGTPQERLEMSISTINRILMEKSAFSDPLG